MSFLDWIFKILSASDNAISILISLYTLYSISTKSKDKKNHRD